MSVSLVAVGVHHRLGADIHEICIGDKLTSVETMLRNL